MAQDRFAELTNSPELVALMPLLYVAWADGELGDQEVESVTKAASLSDAQRASLEKWLDRDAPPTATELLQLYRFVQVRASRLPAEKRRSLVELGTHVAELSELARIEGRFLDLAVLLLLLGGEGSAAQPAQSSGGCETLGGRHPVVV